MKQRKYRLPFALLALLAALPSLWQENGQPSKNRRPRPAAEKEGAEADLRIREGLFIEMEDNRLVWQLKAHSARLFEKDNRASLEKIQACSFTDKGEKILLKGNEGNLRLDTKDLTVSGDVEILADGKVRLTTESLHWDEGLRKISSADWVNIEHERIRVTGKGLEADPDLKNMTINDQVTTYFN